MRLRAQTAFQTFAFAFSRHGMQSNGGAELSLRDKRWAAGWIFEELMQTWAQFYSTTCSYHLALTCSESNVTFMKIYWHKM